MFGLEESDDSTVVTNINDVIKNGSEHINESLDLSRPILATATIPGREFYVEMNAIQKGKGYCLSVRDLTKLTNEIFNDDKTLRFNGEKNAMLAKLEGDIKSPITSISGFSRGLLDGLGGDLTEKQAKYVKIINTNADELYHFMDKFLEFSKAESSIYESNYQNFDIIEMFKAVMKDYEPMLEEKKVSFDLDYETIEKRMAYTDSNAIKAAFRNIIEVALSMTESGFISVKVSHPNEETCVKYDLHLNVETSVIEDHQKIQKCFVSMVSLPEPRSDALLTKNCIALISCLYPTSLLFAEQEQAKCYFNVLCNYNIRQGDVNSFSNGYRWIFQTFGEKSKDFENYSFNTCNGIIQQIYPALHGLKLI
jgi:hypothetical protein